jgi:chromosome segregation ATPase
MEKLTLFFSKIKELTFLQRLFSWRSVRNLSYDAFEEFKSLQKELLIKNGQIDSLEKRSVQLETKNEGLLETIDQYEITFRKKEEEANLLNLKIDTLNREKSELKDANSKYENAEEQRDRSYRNSIGQLNQLKETLEKEINR